MAIVYKGLCRVRYLCEEMARTKQTARLTTFPRTGLPTYQVPHNDLVSASNESETLQKKLDVVNAENVTLKEKLDTAHEQYDAVMKELEKLKSDNTVLKRKNKRKRARVKNTEKELVMMTNRNKLLVSLLHARNKDIKDLGKKIDRLTRKVLHKRAQVEVLRETLVETWWPLKDMPSEHKM